MQAEVGARRAFVGLVISIEQLERTGHVAVRPLGCVYVGSFDASPDRPWLGPEMSSAHFLFCDVFLSLDEK